MRVWQDQSLYTKGMHRLNLLRPQERKFCFSREELTVCRSALSRMQRMNNAVTFLSWFVTVCCDGSETGGGASESICLIYKLSPSKPGQNGCFWSDGGLSSELSLQVAEGRHPRRRGGHAMAIGKISELLTYESNSQFPLLPLVFSLYETQSFYFPTTYNNNGTSASAVWSHLRLLLTLTTWGQNCHIEREAVAIVWSRLR